MMTHERWNKILDESPANGAARLAYADWMEEDNHLFPGRLGKVNLLGWVIVQRWLGVTGRYPFLNTLGDKYWYWLSPDQGELHYNLKAKHVGPGQIEQTFDVLYLGELWECRLPGDVMTCLVACIANPGPFLGRMGAEIALCHVTAPIIRDLRSSATLARSLHQGAT